MCAVVLTWGASVAMELHEAMVPEQSQCDEPAGSTTVNVPRPVSSQQGTSPLGVSCTGRQTPAGPFVKEASLSSPVCVQLCSTLEDPDGLLRVSFCLRGILTVTQAQGRGLHPRRDGSGVSPKSTCVLLRACPLAL